MQSGTGIVTEHGILFVDEDVQFQELYDGQVFPPYLYDASILCTAKAEYQGKVEYLYLPCERAAIDKSIGRLGAPDADSVSIILDDFMVTVNGGATVSVNGNTMTISSTQPLTDAITIKLNRRMPATTSTTGFLIWSVVGNENGNQDMVSGVPANNDPVPSYLKVATAAGSVKASIFPAVKHSALRLPAPF